MCTGNDLCENGECLGIDACPEGQLCDVEIDECTDDTRATWVAYNDMNAGIFPGVGVTGHDYTAENAALLNNLADEALPVMMTGEIVGSYNPTGNGGNFTSGTDGHAEFGGIVDLVGVYELSSPLAENTVTLTGLDPDRSYTITLTANRANQRYAGARYTRVTIRDADTFTNASSEGTIIYDNSSVSFCTGFNTDNGYVARWTHVTAADGSFSVVSQWDDSQGAGGANTKGYSMSAFKLEEF